jgi:hypothetical protein
MGDSADAELSIKFRHILGDVGPFTFSDSASIQSVKETIFTRWPSDGPLAKESPSGPADLRILCSGQFLDNNKTLKDYRKQMGSSEALAVIIMHVLVRPAQAGKAAGDKADTEGVKQPKSGCGCTIC